MTSVSINLASLGTTFLFLIIATILGLASAIACYALGFIGEVGKGFIEAIAGGRPSSRYESKPSALPVFIRALLYFAAGIGSLVLAAIGMAWLSYLLAIVSAFCFGIAVVKFFVRI